MNVPYENKNEKGMFVDVYCIACINMCLLYLHNLKKRGRDSTSQF